LPYHQEAEPATSEVDTGLTGLPTGIPQLDVLTGGLHSGELALLASRPSIGKTSLALNITDYLAVDARRPALYVGLGTSRVEIARRLMCTRGEIPHTALQQRTLPSDVAVRLTQAGSGLRNAPLYLDDRHVRTANEIGTIAQCLNDRLCPAGGLGLVVVDHLSRVEAEYAGQTESEHLIDVAYTLREMAIQMNVAVLGLMQLTCRPPAGQQSQPALTELRGTQYAADLVMLLHRPDASLAPCEPQKTAVDSTAELSVLRRGDCLAETVELLWNSQYTRFSDATVRR